MSFNILKKKNFKLFSEVDKIYLTNRGVVDAELENPVLNCLEEGGPSCFSEWDLKIGRFEKSSLRYEHVFIFDGITFIFELPKKASLELRKLLLDSFLGFFGNFFKGFFNAEFHFVEVYAESPADRLHILIGLDKPVRMTYNSHNNNFKNYINWLNELASSDTSSGLTKPDIGNFESDALNFLPHQYIAMQGTLNDLQLSLESGTPSAKFQVLRVDPTSDASISLLEKKVKEGPSSESTSFDLMFEGEVLSDQQLEFNDHNVSADLLVEAEAFVFLFRRKDATPSTRVDDSHLRSCLATFISSLKRSWSKVFESDLSEISVSVYKSENFIKMCIPLKTRVLAQKDNISLMFEVASRLVGNEHGEPGFHIVAPLPLIYTVPADSLLKIKEAFTARGDTELF